MIIYAYLSVCMYFSICMSVTISQFNNASIYVCRSLCLSVWLAVWLSGSGVLRLSDCLAARLPVYITGRRNRKNCETSLDIWCICDFQSILGFSVNSLWFCRSYIPTLDGEVLGMSHVTPSGWLHRVAKVLSCCSALTTAFARWTKHEHRK